MDPYSRDQTNPVLLLMQLGPGLPIINATRRFERLLGLEHAFTVVYWDQRGTGLSLRESNAEISTARMIATRCRCWSCSGADSTAKHSSPGFPSVPRRRASRCAAP